METKLFIDLSVSTKKTASSQQSRQSVARHSFIFFLSSVPISIPQQPAAAADVGGPITLKKALGIAKNTQLPYTPEQQQGSTL